MSNISVKIKFEKIILFLYIIIIIIALGIFCYLFSFLNKNLYRVIFSKEEIKIEKEIIESWVIGVDIDKFEIIVDNIEKKTAPRELENFKNIFR